MEGKPADACIEATALYSVVWAFEASLPQKARAFFNILVRQMSARTISYTKVGHRKSLSQLQQITSVRSLSMTP